MPWAAAAPAPCALAPHIEQQTLQHCSHEPGGAPLPQLRPFADPPARELLIELQVEPGAAAERLAGVLSLGVPDVIELRLWRLNPSGQRELLAELEPDSHYRDRQIGNPRLYLPLALPADTRQLLLRYRIHAQGRLQPQWLSRAAMEAHNTREDLINGAIAGIMLVMLGVVLVVRLVEGSSAYLAYASLLSSELLALTQTGGYGFAFIWPASPGWNQLAPTVFTTAVLVCHAWFAMSFLQLRQRYPKLFRLHQLALALLLLNLLQLGWDSAAMAMALWTLAYSALALGTGWRAASDRVPGAPLYLLGALALVLLGFVLFLLGVTGHNPFPQLNFFDYPKFGLLLEVGFFSAALVNRVRQRQQALAEARVRRLAETEELLRAETARRDALEAAQRQSLQLASASHDISQPLASLRFAVTALRAGDAQSPVAAHLDRTLSYAETLLRDLIGQSRDALPQAPQSIALAALFEQLVAQYAEQAAARGLRLRSAPCRLRLDTSALLLTRILSNLLSNALRYTPRGGVLIGARRRAGGIEIQVLDSGPGLLDEQLQRLMKPFEQGADAAAQGFGLGLYIVKSLCEQCGYRFSVRSTLQRGSCFAVFIPHAEHLAP